VVMAATVAAVVLTVVHRVSLTAIVRRVRMVTLRHVLMRIRAPKRQPVSKLHQARTRVAQSNQLVHPMVATTAVTTMIAHHAPVVTLATAATLAAVKIAVQRLLIVVVRIHASALRALMRLPVRTKAVKSAARLVVTVRRQVLPQVTATAMIAQRVPSVTVIHVRSLIAHHALTLIAVIVSNALSALLRRVANTLHVHVPSARSHSSVRSVRSTRHVQPVRSSTKPGHHVTRSARIAQRVPPQRHRPTAVIAPHVGLPSRQNTLRRYQRRAANSCRYVAWLFVGLLRKADSARLFCFLRSENVCRPALTDFAARSARPTLCCIALRTLRDNCILSIDSTPLQ